MKDKGGRPQIFGEKANEEIKKKKKNDYTYNIIYVFFFFHLSKPLGTFPKKKELVPFLARSKRNSLLYRKKIGSVLLSFLKKS